MNFSAVANYGYGVGDAAEGKFAWAVQYIDEGTFKVSLREHMVVS